MIDLTKEQKLAYARFIKARDRVGLVPEARNNKLPWVRTADVQSTVDIAGLNHPLFEQNDEWLEYKEASLAWWAIEPEFRKDDRMSSIRGDYGQADNWDERSPKIRDTFSTLGDDES
jgi:hypothetical protein